MKALTLTQPYASLIACQTKRIETRSWYTPHRGPLAIHAARGWPAEDRDYQFSDPFWVELLMRLNLDYVNDFPRGAVVATCRLVDCVRMTHAVNHDPPALAGYGPLSEQERRLGWYAPGRYAWVLDDVVALSEPIPARGELGLWEFDHPSLHGEAA